MSKTYYIQIGNEQVPVSEEVYYAYKRPAWREFKREKVRANNERSLDAFLDCGFDIPSEQTLVDELIADKLLLDELFSALEELTDNERGLIHALFFDERTEREVADSAGVTHQAIHKKRVRILAKLRKLLGT